MLWFIRMTLVCSCGRNFCARDEEGQVRKGSATVRALLKKGVPQHCPKCKKKWQGGHKNTRSAAISSREV